MKTRDVRAAYELGLRPAAAHTPVAALPDAAPADLPVRLVAFYLPQFHAIAQNDKWWGPGFTEWTNTSKSLPRFYGHYQPRMPADLGYYDLSRPETIRRQADLARRAGLEGFCLHYYWFDGEELLDTPLRSLLADRSIDIRFCLNWANENWTRRWDGMDHEVLMQQTYPQGFEASLAEAMAPALADPRYITVNGRPLVLLYKPNSFPDPAGSIARFRAAVAQKIGAEPFIVIPWTAGALGLQAIGADATCLFPPHPFPWQVENHRPFTPTFDPRSEARILDFEPLAAWIDQFMRREAIDLPGVFPSWDNSPRRANTPTIVVNASPAAYAGWLHRAGQDVMARKPPEERFVFINAWNEWAEGAYLEPDRKWGAAYLAATRDAAIALRDGRPVQLPPSFAEVDPPASSTPLRIAYRAYRKLRSVARSVLRGARAEPQHPAPGESGSGRPR